MRISDWSSDVCSSDLRSGGPLPTTQWPPSSPSVFQMILQRLWLASERARLKLLLKSRAELLQQRRESIKTRQEQFQRLATSPKGQRPRQASNRSKIKNTLRSGERSGGTECGSKGRSRWLAYQ